MTSDASGAATFGALRYKVLTSLEEQRPDVWNFRSLYHFGVRLPVCSYNHLLQHTHHETNKIGRDSSKKICITMHYSTSARSTFGELQDLSHLTAVARVKIVKESRKCDHDLRHWVAHANFLDHLTRPSTIAASQQEIFKYGFNAAVSNKGSEPDIEVVEIDGDAPWTSNSRPKPRRQAADSPKISVVHCEVAEDDDEDDLGMITRTIVHHGTVKVVSAR